MKERVAQSLVAPGCGMLANTTGFSLKKDGSVSHCCGSCGSHCCDFPNQQTPRDFLMNNTFVSKIKPSQNAALWLSPPSVVLEEAHGRERRLMGS